MKPESELKERPRPVEPPDNGETPEEPRPTDPPTTGGGGGDEYTDP